MNASMQHGCVVYWERLRRSERIAAVNGTNPVVYRDPKPRPGYIFVELNDGSELAFLLQAHKMGETTDSDNDDKDNTDATTTLPVPVSFSDDEKDADIDWEDDGEDTKKLPSSTSSMDEDDGDIRRFLPKNPFH